MRVHSEKANVFERGRRLYHSGQRPGFGFGEDALGWLSARHGLCEQYLVYALHLVEFATRCPEAWSDWSASPRSYRNRRVRLRLGPEKGPLAGAARRRLCG